MRKFFLLLPLTLGACASQQQIAHNQACVRQEGHAPGGGAAAFGMLGLVYQQSQPEWQAWHQAMQACLKS